ncbi:MAG: hypothetical protein A4E23_01395 [Methanomethylovorans sp. PtaU1.Bin073]|nr:MAG: hypothetical protein A4E23_01395 [Methanomethylovorans sp. PtaU1.Bin073]
MATVPHITSTFGCSYLNLVSTLCITNIWIRESPAKFRGQICYICWIRLTFTNRGCWCVRNCIGYERTTLYENTRIPNTISCVCNGKFHVVQSIWYYFRCSCQYYTGPIKTIIKRTWLIVSAIPDINYTDWISIRQQSNILAIYKEAKSIIIHICKTFFRTKPIIKIDTAFFRDKIKFKNNGIESSIIDKRTQITVPWLTIISVSEVRHIIGYVRD